MSEISESISSFNLASMDVSIPIQLKHVVKTSDRAFNFKMSHLLEKIKEIASFILRFSISALFYWVNPSLFAIGFIGGMIFNDQTHCSIKKIKEVWKNQKIIGTFIGSFACVLSLPVTLATASILWSAHMGALLSNEAQRQAPKQTQQQ